MNSARNITLGAVSRPDGIRLSNAPTICEDWWVNSYYLQWANRDVSRILSLSLKFTAFMPLLNYSVI